MKTCSFRSGWTPMSIGLMVLGFIFFWPLGFAVLAYILWGDQIRAWWDENQYRMQQRSAGPSSGNVAFDEYRKEELERLERERRHLDEEREAFQEFMHNLRRARDREEFDRFKSERNRARSNPANDTGGAESSGAPA